MQPCCCVEMQRHGRLAPACRAASCCDGARLGEEWWLRADCWGEGYPWEAGEERGEMEGVRELRLGMRGELMTLPFCWWSCM